VERIVIIGGGIGGLTTASARCLAALPDGAAALRAYETRRKANAVIELSPRFGKLSEWTNPRACAVRNWMLAHMPRGLLRKQYGRILASDG